MPAEELARKERVQRMQIPDYKLKLSLEGARACDRRSKNEELAGGWSVSF